MFEGKDIVSIMSDLYVKTPEALKSLLEKLKKTGYRIDNLRESKHRADRNVPVEQMEKNGLPMWFAALEGIRFGKCDHCGSHIDTIGIQVHGRKCEICSKVVYYKYVDGSTMKFAFLDDGLRGQMFSPELNMKVKRWDVDNEHIYFYPEFLKGGLGTLVGEKAQKYLNANSKYWQEVDEDGQKLIKIWYPLEWNYKTAHIEANDSYGQMFKHSIVKVWDGKEYSEYDRLPVPEMMSIFEAWHWAPLPPSPRLHEKIMSAAGQVSDTGYYYQDGRREFSDNVWRQMAKFVEHFTSLDIVKFNNAWPRFRNDGPGGIRDLAKFCHDSPVIENKPNIGNMLVGISKIGSGQSLTKGEVDAMLHAVTDKENVDIIQKVLGKKR